MTQSTATRERLTSTAVTLHHPLDYYFNVFLRATFASTYSTC